MLRTIYFVLIFTLVSSTLVAAHIVGGDVTYKCVSADPINRTTTFTVTFTMYRDAIGGGANFDINAGFGIYEKLQGSNIWTHKQTLRINPSDIQLVTYGDECVIVPPNIQVEKANYIFNVTIPWSESVFQITYQRCCRNNTITNLLRPEETGAAFSVEIYGNAIRECNNSPVFNNFPPVLICNQKMLDFDHSAFDLEGDRLEYEFCAPFHAGGTDGATTPGSALACTGVTPNPSLCLPPFAEVTYSGQYSAQNPMGGNPIITIDRNTGRISGIPNLLGQFVVGVCVKEFKNGILIGTIKRDFQFNVVNCQGISETKSFNICEGDSIKVNEIFYSQAGKYTQIFQSSGGCDSTLNIIINALKRSERELYYKLCDDESVTVNDQNYSMTGVYIQNLTNLAGCDSTLNIIIEKFYTTGSILDLQLCDEEKGLVNGIIYEQPGNYIQIIKNINGCDSIININVKRGFSVFAEKTFSLCDQNPILINGQSYSLPGKFTTKLTTTNGCDSTLNIIILPCDQNIWYDLEKCDALTPEKSMVFDEFVPFYSKTLDCGTIYATNIYRDNPQINKHSCTPGYKNSVAMCVSASLSCNFAPSSVTPIVFNFVVSPETGNRIQFNHLIFQQLSPQNYDWIAGPKGLNNYPTKYGLKIFKNNIEIYRKIDISTKTDWSTEKYDFFNDADFTTTDSTEFRIELTPYCPVGNGANVSVWDIDDVKLYFSCHDLNNRIISGKIINPDSELTGMEVRRINNNVFISTKIGFDGSFFMPSNSVDKNYIIEGYQNNNTVYRVTTRDIVVTQRHILGIEPFVNPLQYLAADVNNDQKVTASDLFQMRKIILGIDEYFKSNTSWIFMDEESVKRAINPWSIKKYINIPAGNKDLNHLKFIAIKIGDVDGTEQIKNESSPELK
jgi:hypothetical protein